ncbi:MAG TPA: hypothetical protein VJ792_05305 [Candidatus Nitrosotalea sp.]|nr:hypothetical protein [Candidatus Nitrosotalea sp.]
MDKTVFLTMPEAMASAIGELANERNCSSETIMKLAVARFLFDHTFQEPEVSKGEYVATTDAADAARTPSGLPIDRIVSVQYTLDDGRVIHLLRQNMFG